MTWEPLNNDGTRWRLMATSHAGFSVKAGIVERTDRPWKHDYTWTSHTGGGCSFYSPTLLEAGRLVLYSARAKGYT